jgi:hypothetical protein
MVVQIENRLKECDACEGSGVYIYVPSVWSFADLLSLSKADFEITECEECFEGIMDLEEVEVEL